MIHLKKSNNDILTLCAFLNRVDMQDATNAQIL